MQTAQLRAKAELERRRRLSDTAAASPRKEFVTQYFDDPVEFNRDCFTAPLTPYQEDVARQLVERRRVAVRGPHGLGKTAIAARTILWFALTREAMGVDWKIPTTASVWRQLSKFLWPEIHKWARRLNWQAIPWRGALKANSELLSLSIKLDHGEAFALASDKPDSIEGAHADQLLYIFDESKIIPDATWDSAEGAFSTGDCYWLAVSTPGAPQGRFYDIHKRKPGYEDWDALHVKLDAVINAGRIAPDWAAKREAQWGIESAVYKNRVLGEFASSEEEGVIPLAWIEAANERWLEWHDSGAEVDRIDQIGVDVGRGGDKSVLALRSGNIITELRTDTAKDTMSITGRVAGVLHKWDATAVIDVIGVGAGVVDRLREMSRIGGPQWNIVAFAAGERTDKRDAAGELGFVNKRAAAWYYMRELLNPATNSEVALPPDDILTGELTAPRFRDITSRGYAIESKADIKKRIHRSTDYADAVIQAFWIPETKTEDKKKGASFF